MDILKTDSGVIQLAINGDPNRVISFDPTDVIFAEKFYTLSGEVEKAMNNYQARAQRFSTVKDKDGVPVDIKDRIALLKDLGLYARGKIDEIFGEGTSQKAFGDSLNLDAIAQFFKGVSPYFREARAKKVKKYGR